MPPVVSYLPDISSCIVCSETLVLKQKTSLIDECNPLIKPNNLGSSLVTEPDTSRYIAIFLFLFPLYVDLLCQKVG